MAIRAALGRLEWCCGVCYSRESLMPAVPIRASEKTTDQLSVKPHRGILPACELALGAEFWQKCSEMPWRSAQTAHESRKQCINQQPPNRVASHGPVSDRVAGARSEMLSAVTLHCVTAQLFGLYRHRRGDAR